VHGALAIFHRQDYGSLEMNAQHEQRAARPPRDRPSWNSISRLRREWPLVASFVTTALFLVFGPRWLADLSNPFWLAFVVAWLFAVILLSAFSLVRHGESLAIKLGEPRGTLIMTLAATGVEVIMISAFMFHRHEDTSPFARDAMFAVVMIVLNGLVGISLLVGGLRYHEQTYNLQGANMFLAVIVPLSVLGMVLPNFTVSASGPTVSPLHATFLIVMSAGLYGVFLAVQTSSHREHFVAPDDAAGSHGEGAFGHGKDDVGSVAYHAPLLLLYLLPMVVLSKQFAVPVDHAIGVSHAPPALGGLLVSVIVLIPESLGATRAAMANHLQRSVNILLGLVLADVSLTIPAVLIIGFVTGQSVTLGLDAVDTTLLLLTFGLSTLTFTSARTNMLHGAVHLLLFVAYLMLIFEK
jgi:Ca2+:H+ antiporter